MRQTLEAKKTNVKQTLYLTTKDDKIMKKIKMKK